MKTLASRLEAIGYAVAYSPMFMLYFVPDLRTFGVVYVLTMLTATGLFVAASIAQRFGN